MPTYHRKTVSKSLFLSLLATPSLMLTGCSPSPEDYMTMPKEDVVEIRKFCEGEGMANLSAGKNPVEHMSTKCQNLEKGRKLVRESQDKAAKAKQATGVAAVTRFAAEHQQRQMTLLETMNAEAAPKLAAASATVESLTVGAYVAHLTEVLNAAAAGQIGEQNKDLAVIFEKGGGVADIRTKTPLDYSQKASGMGDQFNVVFSNKVVGIIETGTGSQPIGHMDRAWTEKPATGVLWDYEDTKAQLSKPVSVNSGTATPNYVKEMMGSGLSTEPNAAVVELTGTYELVGKWRGQPIEFVVQTKNIWDPRTFRGPGIGGALRITVQPKVDAKTQAATWSAQVTEVFAWTDASSYSSHAYPYSIPR